MAPYKPNVPFARERERLLTRKRPTASPACGSNARNAAFNFCQPLVSLNLCGRERNVRASGEPLLSTFGELTRVLGEYIRWNALASAISTCVLWCEFDCYTSHV